MRSDVTGELKAMVREALSNAVRHADATSVTVRVYYEPRRLRASIEDDGIGVDKPSPTSGSGVGILGIRERAARIRGRLSFEPLLRSGKQS